MNAPRHPRVEWKRSQRLVSPTAGGRRSEKNATVRGLTVAMTRFNQMVTACGSRAVSAAATAYSSQPGQAQERQSAGSWD